MTRSTSAEGRSILLMTGMIVEVVLHGQVEVGERLGLDALGGVDQKQHPFAGGERPGHLVGEIDMARRVDQVQGVGPAVLGPVGEGDGLALDRDPPLPLDVHVVEDLVLEIPVIHDAGVLDQPVGQGRLPMVDMGDDAEIADIVHISLTFLKDFSMIAEVSKLRNETQKALPATGRAFQGNRMTVCR